MRDVITMLKSCQPSVEGETESEREELTDHIEKCIKGIRREMDCPLFPSPLFLPLAPYDYFRFARMESDKHEEDDDE